MPRVEGRDLPFDEAIGFLREKVRIPTRTWTDIWEGHHARAFVVAGAVKAELLTDFRDVVLKGIEEGTTLADFRADFDRIVAKHGWSYRGGRGWRSKVIFETNMRTAYQAGRWEQIQQNAERRPYLRYVSVLDEKTRPEHRKWHGTVLRIDDAWWRTHYPPNGWGCRCTVQQLSARDMKRFGYEEAPAAPPSPMETKSVNTPGGPVPVEVPEGIDPGWGYNVGEAAYGSGPDRLALSKHGPFGPLEAPRRSPPPALPRLRPVTPSAGPGPLARSEEDLRTALRAALGADEATLVDPTGNRVRVGQAIVGHMLEREGRRDGRERYFPLIPELVTDPQEIWIGFARNEATGQVALRSRYVKALDLDGETIVFVADADKGIWSGFTFFRNAGGPLGTLRSGLRIFGGEE